MSLLWKRVGTLLKQRRVARGVTWRGVERQLQAGLTAPVIRDHERGTILKVTSLDAHCAALGTTSEAVLREVLAVLPEPPLHVSKQLLLDAYDAADANGKELLRLAAVQILSPWTRR